MNNLEDEIRAFVTRMDEQQSNQESEENTPQEDVQDIYVLIVRESEAAADHTQIIESSPTQTTTQQDSFLSAYVFVCCSLFLICSTLLFQLYCIVNPPIATITIIPKSQTVNLTGTLQLGRVLPPLTISQSQTTATTGKGHQDAKAATGYLTFYNGQFQSIKIAAGTILTGADGVQIITDQDTYVPAGNPVTGYGHTTVLAHAINKGSKGNIAAYDMNEACCATSVLAVNLTSFQYGQDERTYITVTQKDIHSVSTVLATSLTQSMQGALQGQLNQNEQLQILPCSSTVISDHQPGDEATQVKVTVSQTCSAVAYNSQELATKATDFLTHQATTTLATGYSLLGAVKISVTQATIQKHVILSFHESGTWVYGIFQKAQEQIKHVIAGKTRQEALRLLAELPGVAHVAIAWGDDTRLPKDSSYIHITLFIS